VLEGKEWRRLIDAIPTDTVRDLRDCVGGGIFPIEKLQVTPVFDRREAVKTVLSIDKAGTVGDEGSYTAIVLMHKMKNGTFVIERVVRGHWGALDREKEIKKWAEHDRNNLRYISSRFTVVLEQEPGSGGKESAEATIRNLAGFTVIADKPGAGRSKEVRAEPFAAQCQGGNVHLVASHPNWIPDFLEEAESWPNGTTKDQIDAAAQAFNHLTSGQGYDISVWRKANRGENA
jgi:predicted phage terminase large subunit-like protein